MWSSLFDHNSKSLTKVSLSKMSCKMNPVYLTCLGNLQPNRRLLSQWGTPTIIWTVNNIIQYYLKRTQSSCRLLSRSIRRVIRVFNVEGESYNIEGLCGRFVKRIFGNSELMFIEHYEIVIYLDFTKFCISKTSLGRLVM